MGSAVPATGRRRFGRHEGGEKEQDDNGGQHGGMKIDGFDEAKPYVFFRKREYADLRIFEARLCWSAETGSMAGFPPDTGGPERFVAALTIFATPRCC